MHKDLECSSPWFHLGFQLWFIINWVINPKPAPSPPAPKLMRRIQDNVTRTPSSYQCWVDLSFSKGRIGAEDHLQGQSELTATNAPVGRSVHWMGCVFSFGAGWGSSQSISFCCWPLYFFFLFLFLVVFPGPDLTHSYPAHFPTLISIAPTYWHSYPNN